MHDLVVVYAPTFCIPLFYQIKKRMIMQLCEKTNKTIKVFSFKMTSYNFKTHNAELFKILYNGFHYLFATWRCSKALGVAAKRCEFT